MRIERVVILKTCPECGWFLDDNAKTCSNCGYIENKKIAYCPKCGKPLFIAQKVKYCMMCGAKIDRKLLERLLK
jgi:exosome complex RNA-binding protein Csl4